MNPVRSGAAAWPPLPSLAGFTGALKILSFAVRPEGAFHQWREVPPRELSIALVADERFGWVTGQIEAS
jgi:hypothetical protein